MTHVDLVRLPSGRMLNMAAVIEIEEMPLPEGSQYRRAAAVVTDADGGGRVFHDADADALLSVLIDVATPISEWIPG